MKHDEQKQLYERLYIKCDICDGVGDVGEGVTYDRCDACKGEGYVPVYNAVKAPKGWVNIDDIVVCPDCRGSKQTRRNYRVVNPNPDKLVMNGEPYIDYTCELCCGRGYCLKDEVNK